ncbi:MAG: hypothetical protein IKJ01_09855 [Lachnospiraceae bacterium]|nr:hypothetical protein [Lachnospiraceae bacterium]
MKKMLAKSLIVLSLLFTVVVAGNNTEAVVVAQETGAEAEPAHDLQLPDYEELSL